MPSISRPALAALATVALGAPAVAGAATSHYVSRSFTEPARAGLAVTGPLSAYKATSSARVVVPTTWRSLAAPAGSLRLRTTQNPSCHYDMTFTVTSVLGDPGTAADRVAAELPSPGRNRILDSGTHGGRAFRVVRPASSGGRIRISALWAGVLTKRSDIAPAGKVAWSEIRVSAISGKGDECHAGTYRESLGPAIGDALAVARARLHFAKAK